MNKEYHYIYNNFIKLTTNKNLYKGLKNQDTFYDRLLFFLIHFAFFLKAFKNNENSNLLQKIYDYNFRYLELSIREIGYGDQSINKKMKDYINLFHSIVSEVHFWPELNKTDKIKRLSKFFSNFNEIDYLIEYFDDFYENISKKTLNSYLKDCK
tara:strand:- start:164 stop:625 length:462 start_codon:yes stop_codon:yes gene_type:complete